MALTVYKAYIPDDVPPGHFSGKLIKAIYTDTKNSIFPCDSLYGKDWREAISYLGKKRHKNTGKDEVEEEAMESPRVYLPLEHPLEGRNNPQPSKPFMHWRVPSRYSDGGRSTSREARLMKEIQNDSKRTGSRQHEITHTTHHAPPIGKFQPIKSEQQEHMAEVLKREEAIKKYREGKLTTLPRLSFSANPSQSKALPLEPKTFSAAQRWLKRNPGKEKLANQVLRQCGRSEVDKTLENTLEPNSQKAVRDWLKNATESDRQAAINFFSSMAGSRFLGGVSGSHPQANVTGDKNARLRAVLQTLEKHRAEAPSQDNPRHQTVDDSIKALLKAARRKHLRLLSPDTRLRQKEYQTWHHMPVYQNKGHTGNVRPMYSLPNAPLPKDFRIHPEWES